MGLNRSIHCATGWQEEDFSRPMRGKGLGESVHMITDGRFAGGTWAAPGSTGAVTG